MKKEFVKINIIVELTKKVEENLHLLIKENNLKIDKLFQKCIIADNEEKWEEYEQVEYRLSERIDIQLLENNLEFIELSNENFIIIPAEGSLTDHYDRIKKGKENEINELMNTIIEEIGFERVETNINFKNDYEAGIKEIIRTYIKKEEYENYSEYEKEVNYLLVNLESDLQDSLYELKRIEEIQIDIADYKNNQ